MRKNVPLNGKRKIALVVSNPEYTGGSLFYKIVEDAFGLGVRSSDGWFSWAGCYGSVEGAYTAAKKELWNKPFDLLIFNDTDKESYICEAVFDAVGKLKAERRRKI